MGNSGKGGKVGNKSSWVLKGGVGGKDGKDPIKIRPGKEKKDVKLFPSILIVHEKELILIRILESLVGLPLLPSAPGTVDPPSFVDPP